MMQAMIDVSFDFSHICSSVSFSSPTFSIPFYRLSRSGWRAYRGSYALQRRNWWAESWRPRNRCVVWWLLGFFCLFLETTGSRKAQNSQTPPPPPLLSPTRLDEVLLKVTAMHPRTLLTLLENQLQEQHPRAQLPALASEGRLAKKTLWPWQTAKAVWNKLIITLTVYINRTVICYCWDSLFAVAAARISCCLEHRLWLCKEHQSICWTRIWPPLHSSCRELAPSLLHGAPKNSFYLRER